MSVLLVALSYLIGSISFSYIISKLVKGIDIRKVGSGNAGATNISRILGLKYAVLVLFLDALKGFVAVYLAFSLQVGTLVTLLCGASVIAGHNWPIFSGFKGGRGVATTLGVFLGLAPLPTLVVFLLCIIIIFLTRYVSVGSLLGAIAIPIVMLLFNYPQPYFFFGLAICLLLIWKHRPNIKRLLKGKELKLGEKVDRN